MAGAMRWLADGRIDVDGLAEVVRLLRGSDVDDWTLAGWLTTPRARLQDLCPADWRRSGRDTEVVVAPARGAATRVSQ